MFDELLTMVLIIIFFVKISHVLLHKKADISTPWEGRKTKAGGMKKIQVCMRLKITDMFKFGRFFAVLFDN